MDDQRDKLDLLRSSDFARVAKFIEGTTGIKVPPGKKTMVEGRLRRRARALGCANLGEYCNKVFEQGGFESESVHLIDAVTTNKTEFFREPAHFDFLTRRCAPQFLAEGRRMIQAWSAASSTGQEPYTLAMALEEAQEQPFLEDRFLTQNSAQVQAVKAEAGAKQKIDLQVIRAETQ